MKYSPALGAGASALSALASAAMFLMPLAAQAQSDGERGSKLYLEALHDGDKAEQARSKIVGGEMTRIQANPWQIGLVLAERPNVASGQFCGGSIVAKEWVVTAAHCVTGNMQPEQVNILSGTASLADGSGVRSMVDRIEVHPSYNRPPFDFDIALLHISQRGAQMRGRAIAGPANIAEPMMRFLPLRVTGWGVSVRHGEATMNLQAVELPYVPLQTCGQAQALNDVLTPNMLCAGADAPGASSCQGDSGGPVTVEFDGERHLAGIVSFGPKGCGGYSVFTRVSRFTDWVTQTTGGAVDWR